MSSTLLDVISVAAAIITIAVAAYIDIKTLKIPNRLTFPVIGLGLLLAVIRCLSGYPAFELVIIVSVSWAFVYALWAAGLWGGGDSKAVLALSILLSPIYPALSFLVVLLLFIAVSIFLRESAFYLTKALWTRDPLSFVLAVSPASTAALLFALSSGAGLIIASLLALLSLAVMADLSSAFLPRHEKALLGPSSEISLTGRRMAEDIFLSEKGLTRIRRPTGILVSALSRKAGDDALLIIPRRPSGLLPEDVRMLKRHVSSIYIVPQRPMGPLLLLSLMASLTSLYVVSLPEVAILL